MLEDLFCLADEPNLDYEEEKEVIYDDNGGYTEAIATKDSKGNVISRRKRILKLRSKRGWDRNDKYWWEVSYD